MPALVLAALLSASVDPAYVESIPIVPPGFLYGTGMEWAPDGSGRLFIIGQNGLIHVWKNGTFTQFAALSPVYTNSECGLIGMAFDPDFIDTGYVYFFITVSATEQQIQRLTDVGGVGLNKTVIVAGLDTTGANHDGGGLVFGKDGRLYWGIGDNGGYRGVSGDLTLTASKVGRVNRDGTVPKSNPYVGVALANPRIWASGFRNPFTMSVRPRTGDVWVNTVGTYFEQIFVPSAGDNAGYNGFEIDQVPPYLRPVLWYKTNGSQTYAIASAARTSGVETFTTTTSHYLHKGQNVTLSGASDPSFNGSGRTVDQVLSNSKFTVGHAGPDGSATGGTVATLDIGGAITGGAFLDTSNTPTGVYRDDFFFADYNTGNVTRVVLSQTGPDVAAVLPFATGLGGITDVSIGPDGAIYVLRIAGSVVRYAPTSNAGLVVAPLSRPMLEGGKVAVSVSLGAAPTANVTLTAARTSGDPDVAVASGATLTFSPTDWNVPQTVVMAAAQDADTADDSAVVTVMGGGFSPETIDLFVADDDAPALVAGPALQQVTEGATALFSVSLAFMPAAPVTVTVARTSGDPDLAVTNGATLTFNAANYATPQPVTVAAAQDADTVNGATTFTVSAPGYPSTTFSAIEVEDDAVAPIIVTPPVTTAIAGAPYTYDVNASGVPVPTFTLLAGPPGLTLDPVTGVLAGAVAAIGTTTVRIRAQNGVPPDDVQNFQLDVVADAPPTATLDPLGTVAGVTTLAGDGQDDVGTVRGDFAIDGTRLASDAGMANHYAAAWDTRTATNGAHTVRFTVFDTAGQSGFAEAQVTVANPVAAPDAGTDAGVVVVPGLDAGIGPVEPARGCGCSASGPGWFLLVLARAPLTRRRCLRRV